jgi:hypothetical protein
MSKTEIGKLTAAKCTLSIIASGLKLKGVRVRDVAEQVGAPKTSWRAKTLLRWIDDKIILTT